MCRGSNVTSREIKQNLIWLSSDEFLTYGNQIWIVVQLLFKQNIINSYEMCQLESIEKFMLVSTRCTCYTHVAYLNVGGSPSPPTISNCFLITSSNLLVLSLLIVRIKYMLYSFLYMRNLKLGNHVNWGLLTSVEVITK